MRWWYVGYIAILAVGIDSVSLYNLTPPPPAVLASVPTSETTLLVLTLAESVAPTVKHI